MPSTDINQTLRNIINKRIPATDVYDGIDRVLHPGSYSGLISPIDYSDRGNGFDLHNPEPWGIIPKVSNNANQLRFSFSFTPIIFHRYEVPPLSPLDGPYFGQPQDNISIGDNVVPTMPQYIESQWKHSYWAFSGEVSTPSKTLIDFSDYNGAWQDETGKRISKLTIVSPDYKYLENVPNFMISGRTSVGADAWAMRQPLYSFFQLSKRQEKEIESGQQDTSSNESVHATDQGGYRHIRVVEGDYLHKELDANAKCLDGDFVVQVVKRKITPHDMRRFFDIWNYQLVSDSEESDHYCVNPYTFYDGPGPLRHYHESSSNESINELVKFAFIPNVISDNEMGGAERVRASNPFLGVSNEEVDLIKELVDSQDSSSIEESQDLLKRWKYVFKCSYNFIAKNWGDVTRSVVYCDYDDGVNTDIWVNIEKEDDKWDFIYVINGDFCVNNKDEEKSWPESPIKPSSIIEEPEKKETVGLEQDNQLMGAGSGRCYWVVETTYDYATCSFSDYIGSPYCGSVSNTDQWDIVGSCGSGGTTCTFRYYHLCDGGYTCNPGDVQCLFACSAWWSWAEANLPTLLLLI